MPLGIGTATPIAGIPTGQSFVGHCLGRTGAFRVVAWSRFSDRNRVAKRHWRCMWWPVPRNVAVSRPLSMPNTPWIRRGRRNWVWSWKTLLVSQPSSGEEAMHITEMLIKSNAVDVIVVDSVAALVPKKELRVKSVIRTWAFKPD